MAKCQPAEFSSACKASKVSGRVRRFSRLFESNFFIDRRLAYWAMRLTNVRWWDLLASREICSEMEATSSAYAVATTLQRRCIFYRATRSVQACFEIRPRSWESHRVLLAHVFVHFPRF